MFVVIETKKKNIHSGPKGHAKRRELFIKSACCFIEYFIVIE